MGSPQFQLAPSLANLPLSVLRKKYDELTPEERQALGLVRPATDQEAADYQPSQASGAPADFAGPVLPNPDNRVVSPDTASGVPVTRLPVGTTFQRGNFKGRMPADVSNPPAAQILPAQMRAVQAKFDPSADYAPAKFDPTQSYDTAETSSADNRPPAASKPVPAELQGPAEDNDPALHSLEKLGGQALRGIYEISTPGVAASVVQKISPSTAAKIPAQLQGAPIQQLPDKLMTQGLLGLSGAAEAAPEAPSAEAVAANRAKAAATATEGNVPLNAIVNRVKSYLLRRIPGMGTVLDTHDLLQDLQGAFAGKGEPPEVPTPKPPADFGTPTSMRGSREVVQAAPLARGGQPAPPSPAEALGKIPVRTPQTVSPIATPTPANAMVQRAGSPYSVENVQPGTRIPEPRGQAELLDNKAIEEMVREKATQEQQQRIHESRLQYRAPTKNALVTRAGGSYPEQPVEFSKTPTAASARKPATPATRAPTPAMDDLTELLLESLKQAKLKKR